MELRVTVFLLASYVFVIPGISKVQKPLITLLGAGNSKSTPLAIIASKQDFPEGLSVFLVINNFCKVHSMLFVMFLLISMHFHTRKLTVAFAAHGAVM